MIPTLHAAGAWFLRSGIQEPAGGVARYYRADLGRNCAVSTEITGYAVSALVYLHSLSGEEIYLERAVAGAEFLSSTAWDRRLQAIPFELDPPAYTYFFDCGIIVRGLLAAWRAAGRQEFLDAAAEIGRQMMRDFVSPEGECHPILSLPEKQPEPRDAMRWSRSPGCYQLKSAMAWWDLAEATRDDAFRGSYQRVLESGLRTADRFLPGHPERRMVMDRLHAFCYFLEGLLPAASERRCATALCTGIQRVSEYLRGIAPEFARSDVYAQLLRIRLYADSVGAVPLDRQAAAEEAERLIEFQAVGGDARTAGGFYFGRRAGEWVPHINPVSTAFGLQALALWEEARSGKAPPPQRHLLI